MVPRRNPKHSYSISNHSLPASQHCSLVQILSSHASPWLIGAATWPHKLASHTFTVTAGAAWRQAETAGWGEVTHAQTSRHGESYPVYVCMFCSSQAELPKRQTQRGGISEKRRQEARENLTTINPKRFRWPLYRFTMFRSIWHATPYRGTKLHDDGEKRKCTTGPVLVPLCKGGGQNREI